MTESDEKEKPIGLKVREEAIASITVADIDCDMMDKKTRQVLLYLVGQELKKLNTFPTAWVQGSKAELEGIKAGLEMCKVIRSRKGSQDATEKSSAEGENQESSQ